MKMKYLVVSVFLISLCGISTCKEVGPEVVRVSVTVKGKGTVRSTALELSQDSFYKKPTLECTETTPSCTLAKGSDPLDKMEFRLTAEPAPGWFFERWETPANGRCAKVGQETFVSIQPLDFGNAKLTPQGHYECVAIFKEDSFGKPPVIESFLPTTGKVGDEITITGNNFENVGAVSFNDVFQPTFSVTDIKELKAVVPNRAKTGRIRVYTRAGAATSKVDFVLSQIFDPPDAGTDSPPPQSDADPKTDSVVSTTPMIVKRASLDVYSAAWDGKEYVAAGTGLVARSSDGITWTTQTPLPQNSVAFQHLACSPTACVTFQPFREMYSSTDKVVWTKSSDAKATNGANICWDGSRFIVITSRYEVGTNGKPYAVVLSSPDGSTWSSFRAMDAQSLPVELNGYNIQRNIYCSSSRYVLVGNDGVLTSTDAQTWVKAASLPVAPPIGAVAGSGSLLLALRSEFGSPSDILTSTDGSNWIKQSAGARGQLLSSAWTGSTFVIAGREAPLETDPTQYHPRVFVSSDGQTWKPRFGEDSRRIDFIVGGGPRVVLFRFGSEVYTMEK